MTTPHDTSGAAINGVHLIAKERQRQISREGYDAKHDDEHSDGELALAAACYATPMPLYVREEYAAGVSFEDPWPWRGLDDKRQQMAAANYPMDPREMTNEQRINLLVKAGALIAAEIDRLQRKQ